MEPTREQIEATIRQCDEHRSLAFYDNGSGARLSDLRALCTMALRALDADAAAADMRERAAARLRDLRAAFNAREGWIWEYGGDASEWSAALAFAEGQIRALPLNGGAPATLAEAAPSPSVPTLDEMKRRLAVAGDRRDWDECDRLEAAIDRFAARSAADAHEVPALASDETASERRGIVHATTPPGPRHAVPVETQRFVGTPPPPPNEIAEHLRARSAEDARALRVGRLALEGAPDLLAVLDAVAGSLTPPFMVPGERVPNERRERATKLRKLAAALRGEEVQP